MSMFIICSDCTVEQCSEISVMCETCIYNERMRLFSCFLYSYMKPNLENYTDIDPCPSNSEQSVLVPKHKLFSSSHLPLHKRALLFLGLDRLAGTGMKLAVHNDFMAVSPNIDDTSNVVYNSIV